MPTYDYKCQANDRVVEVRHSISDTLTTWGELCEKAGIAPGDTALDAPVTRLATGGQVVRSGSLGDKASPCQMGAPCRGPGNCGLN